MLAVLSVIGLLVYLAAVRAAAPVRRRAGPGGGRLAWIAGTRVAVRRHRHLAQRLQHGAVQRAHDPAHGAVADHAAAAAAGRAGHPRPAHPAPRPGRGRRPRALLLDALHSRFARFVSHPLFTVPLFIASLYGVYFTPLFDALMGNPVGHQLMLAHFVVTGLLFFGPIVGQDPWPRTLSHPGRMLELFLSGAVPRLLRRRDHDGRLAGGATRSPIRRPAGGSTRCSDQGVAGGIVWAFGELPTVLVLAVVFFSWAGSEERRGRALDRAADRTATPSSRPTTPGCGPWRHAAERPTSSRHR